MLKNSRRIKTISPSIITAGMHVSGDIIGGGAVEVNGIVDGQIKCLSVKLGQGSVVNGDITAEKAEIHGEVNGNVTAKTIICGGESKIVGDIVHQRIDMKDGATLEGKCEQFVQEVVIEEQPVENAVVAQAS